MNANHQNPLYIPNDLLFGEQHTIWLKALIADNVDVVNSCIATANQFEKHILFEGWIKVVDWLEHNSPQSAERALVFCTRRAWSLAAVAGSHQVICKLFKEGIDIFQKDSLGNNVIHALIIHACACSDTEGKLLDTYIYLQDLLPRNQFSELLVMENSDRVRPLELAAHLQTMRLLDAIMNTPGPYLVKQKQCGLLVVNYYDVTEYESGEGSRPWAHNPMFLLMFLGVLKLNNNYVQKCFSQGVIHNWIQCRGRAIRPFIWVWLFLRITIVITAFFLADLIEPITEEIPSCGIRLALPFSFKLGFNILIVVYTTVLFIYDVYDVIHVHTYLNVSWKTNYPRRSGTTIANFVFYRGTQFLFNASMLGMCSSRISAVYGGPQIPDIVGQTAFIMVIFGSIWSLFFFVQLLPSIGYYVISIQRMLNDFAQFGAIIIISFIPYGITFPRFIMPNNNGTCPDEFSDPTSDFYSTFTAMLNMVDFRSFDAPSSRGLWLLHVIFVCEVVILLLNFLIAILSNSYNVVAANRDVILFLQWLSISSTIDYRMPWFLKSLYCTLKKHQYTYEDGRYYVIDVKSVARQITFKYKD